MSHQDINHSVSNFNFVLDLIGAIKDKNGSDENIFVSPFSINMALAMTLAGAKGETSTQMKSAMKIDSMEDDSVIHDAFKTTIGSLAAIESQTSGIKLHTANRMYVYNKTNLLNEFKEILQTKYDSTSILVDFEKEYEKVRLEINKWVEEKTANKIKDLMAPGVLNAGSILVLVNAVYFKGEWDLKFNPRATKKEDFFINESTKITADMMFKFGQYSFARDQNLDCQIVELNYTNKNVSMFVLVPNEKFGLKELENKLTEENLNNLFNQMNRVKVYVRIPKLKIETFLSLNDILKNMGMKDLFDSNKADLSGIDGTRDLFVSKVAHKAFIDVNEEGCEVTAATRCVVKYGRNPNEIKNEIFADHPFILFIRDNSTSSILFWGRIVKPS